MSDPSYYTMSLIPVSHVSDLRLPGLPSLFTIPNGFNPKPFGFSFCSFDTSLVSFL